MDRRVWSGVLLIPLLVLGGCASAPERDKTGPLPEYAEADSRCRDISGSFQARPHRIGEAGSGERPLLAQTLLPSNGRLTLATTVTLQMSEAGTFHVTALDDNAEVLARHHYTADSGVFECDDGQLLFFPQRLDEPPPEGIDWEKMVLRRTEDGSLMVRKGGLFSGMIFLIFPMYVSTEDWFLFKPAP